MKRKIATFRYKYGANIGYTINVFEVFNENNSIIQTYDLQANTYDNSQFIEEYQKLVNKRAGIEGIPSTFRRKYNIDNLPIRDKLCVKMWLGFKIMAYNSKKLLKGLKDKNIPSIYSIYTSLITISVITIQEKEFNI